MSVAAIGNLTNLTLLDLGKNRWCSEEYTSITDVQKLLAFLRGKSTRVIKVDERTIKSKEDRISEGLKKAAEAAEAAKTVKVQKQPEGSVPADYTIQNFLLKICGLKESIVIVKLDPIYLNMTKVDTFIFDAKDVLFVWLSINSPQYKREKALSLAYTLGNEYGVPFKVVNRSNQKDKAEQDAAMEFWSRFGEKGHIPQKGPKSDKDMSAECKKYKLRIISEDNDDGRIDTKTISGDVMSKTHLKSTSCAILDDTRDIYVWKGTFSSVNCQSYAYLMAQVNFIDKKKREE